MSSKAVSVSGVTIKSWAAIAVDLIHIHIWPVLSIGRFDLEQPYPESGPL